MTSPEARCLCGTPMQDHANLRYVLKAWIQHRWVFGVAAVRGHG